MRYCCYCMTAGSICIHPNGPGAETHTIRSLTCNRLLGRPWSRGAQKRGRAAPGQTGCHRQRAHLEPHSMGGGGGLMDREDKGESSDLVEQHDSG